MALVSLGRAATEVKDQRSGSGSGVVVLTGSTQGVQSWPVRRRPQRDGVKPLLALLVKTVELPYVAPSVDLDGIPQELRQIAPMGCLAIRVRNGKRTERFPWTQAL